MKSKQYKLSTVLLSCVLAVSTLLLIFLLSNSYRQLKRLSDTEKITAHSQKVSLELEKLISYVKDAETGQRGFILTNDTLFLSPYHGAEKKVEETIMCLRTLTGGDKLQQQNLDFLQALIRQKFVEMKSTMRSNQEFSMPDFKKQMIKGKNLMELLRARTQKMIVVESVHLRRIEEMKRNEIEISPSSYLLTGSFAIFVFIAAFLKINKDVKALRNTNNQLRINKEIFEHSEQIAEISNWSWDIESGELYFSDNQYRLLGLSPGEFKPTMEKFLEFVHPDDRHIITEGNSRTQAELRGSIAYYRIIRKDGKLRNFKSISKIIEDNFDRKILIGVNADITEQYEKDKELEERLFDLERSNKELSAFNHVASHDLQEPLRKVQTLISRIKEKDFDTFPPKTRDYFQRIQVAANRMQKLITDLLMFSRSHKADKSFAVSDLNKLLELAKNDLTDVLAEKKAVIKSVSLPTVDVIPFQIHQLFVNLIGNAVKYAKDEVPPVITITYKLADPSEISDHGVSSESYHKISVSDNGIGFEQQYANSIFTLFQRLHHDSEYSGTGIGLAICKKIVGNHKGHITAEGIPDIGARFNIYLPASEDHIVNKL